MRVVSRDVIEALSQIHFFGCPSQPHSDQCHGGHGAGMHRGAVMSRDDRPVPIQRPNGMTVSATACLRWPRTPIAPIRSTVVGSPTTVSTPRAARVGPLLVPKA